ncbi:MAG: LUD domain-containing protein [Chitinophagaceae bacterium]|jgi:L-lactate dehydrogenase complex protein LldG|nr:LUD domain-containing protein [Chitinophagaceae bacterium]
MSSAKENILKKIHDSKKRPTPMPFPDVKGIEQASVFKPSKGEIMNVFAKNFAKIQGKFAYCKNKTELVKELKIMAQARKWNEVFCCEQEIINLLEWRQGFHSLTSKNMENTEAAITGCEQLIARTGSILLSSVGASGRTTAIYTPVHICIAFPNQLVFDIGEGLKNVKDRYASLPSLITLASGPSRTADIEKTLVTGVHGPREVFCFVVGK